LLPESPMMVGGIKENPRVGGLLQDFSSGFKENAQSKFNPSNFEDNTTDYGGKKGLAYRLGEGAGSLGKFMASSPGRGLLTAGLVGLTGGNPTQAMTYGLQAGLGNYNNVQEDKMNRGLLQQQGIDTSNIRGYLTNDRTKSYADNYKSLNDTRYKFASLELRDKLATVKDNTTKAKMIMDGFKSNMIDETQAVNLANEYGLSVKDLNESNQTRNADMREELLPYQKYALKTSPQVALAGLGLRQAEFAVEAPYKQAQTQKALMELGTGGIPLGEYRKMTTGITAIENQLDRFSDSFKGLPDKMESYTAGQVRNLTGTQTKAEANFNSQRTLLFNKIARELGGEKGVLSDQDIARVEKSLPSLTDSYQQKQAKMQAIYDLLNDTKNKYGMNNQQPRQFAPKAEPTGRPKSQSNKPPLTREQALKLAKQRGLI
jgi:hypothetical protein